MKKNSAHQKEWGARLISELALTCNERVLDLGCGDGMNTALIAEVLPNGEVVGIDASKGMIDTAKPKEKCFRIFLLSLCCHRFPRIIRVVSLSSLLTRC